MDGSALLAELNRTSDYAEAREQPLWLQAAQILSSDDSTSDRIAAAVEIGFEKREFAVRGEFFQIAGIRLWFAEMGLIAKSSGDIVAESKAYIDDLARDERLETSLDEPWDAFTDTAYGGYEVANSRTPEYREIIGYYKEVAEREEEKRYPRIAQNLLDKLLVDPDGYLFDIVPNQVRHGRYWYRPVLASLPPGNYARVVFEASPEIQRRGIEALYDRHREPSPPLRSERAWIAEVRSELLGLAAKAKPMTRYRLRSLIARNLDPLVPEGGVAQTAAPTDSE